MSYEFSESEVFVLGALVTAANDDVEQFYSQAQELFGMLGLWREPDTDHDGEEPIEEVPEDTIWGTAEAPGDSSSLSKTQVVEMRESLQHRVEEALQFLESRASLSPVTASKLREGVLSLAQVMWVAYGFAPSTPNVIYAMRGDGRMFLVKRVAPLPSGLVRLILAHVGPCAAIPLAWLMAMPEVFASMPQSSIGEIVPSIETGVCVIGEDKSSALIGALQQLVSSGDQASTYSLGAKLWALRTVSDRFLSSGNESTPDKTGDAATITSETLDQGSHGDRVPPAPDDMPDLLKTVFNLAHITDPTLHGGAAAEWERRTELRIKNVQEMIALSRSIQSLADTCHMPQIEVLIAEVNARLGNHSASLHESYEWATKDTDNAVLWFETSNRIGNAICIAYGELLLRERHAPDPIPTARGKTELLRQAPNLRQLVSMAITHLRRDASDGGNSVVAMTLLVPVIEPLVRQAAERYLRRCPTTKVADLLHIIRTEAPTRPSPEREEMEIIGRVGLALHHGFRNDTIHNVATIAGDWESAQFIAFGLLSILNVLDRARSRTT